MDAPKAFRGEAVVERQARKASEDSALVRALGLAHYWQTLLDSGKAKTPADIARLEAMNVVQVREILRLTLLAPDIIEAIVDARAPRRLTLEFLLRRSIPRDWEEQRGLVESVAFAIERSTLRCATWASAEALAGSVPGSTKEPPPCGPASGVLWGPGAKHPRLPD